MFWSVCIFEMRLEGFFSILQNANARMLFCLQNANARMLFVSTITKYDCNSLLTRD